MIALSAAVTCYINAARAKRPQYVPTVLTKQEAIAIEVSEIVFQVGEDGLESGLHGKWGDHSYAHYLPCLLIVQLTAKPSYWRINGE